MHTPTETARAILRRCDDKRTVKTYLAAKLWPQITRQECRGTGGDADLARVVQFALNHLPGGQS